MNLTNLNKFIVLFCKYITNINRTFKDIKSNAMANFIQTDYKGLTITTNKVISILNLSIIKKYIKNVNVVDFNNIMILRLSQFKSYIKILEIPYLIKNTNIPISFNIIESVLQSTYIFNNIVLTLKSRIIKAFSKLGIVDIWIDICDIQSSSKAKSLINKCFNIENHIVTI